jgi:hypothetical protein
MPQSSQCAAILRRVASHLPARGQDARTGTGTSSVAPWLKLTSEASSNHRSTLYGQRNGRNRPRHDRTVTAHKRGETQRLSNWSIIEPEAINATRGLFDLTQPPLIKSRRTAIDPADVAITGGNAGEDIDEFGRDRPIASGKLIRQLITDGLDAISIGVARLRGRLSDLLPIVRIGLYHPGFGFSSSIKNVAPALCPDIT